MTMTRIIIGSPSSKAEVREFLGEETMALLDACPNVDEGCFAARPEVLKDVRHGLMDAMVRRVGENEVIACIEAGKAGEPLENVTYNGVELVPIGQGRSTVVNTDEQIGVQSYSRSARCAYVCGSLAASCPLLQD